MKILTLDGGGLFGVGQAAILSKVPDIDMKFNCIAGTSVGAIVGAMVATGVDQSTYMNFFTTLAPKIFAGYGWRHYMPLTPRYPDKELNKALQGLFPQRFADVNVPMLVTAADLNGRCLKVFSSLDKSDGDLPLWEVLRIAVAAETYFLPYKGYADGGIYANNPSMVGVAGVCSAYGLEPSEISLCSIGTGNHTPTDAVGSTNYWSMLSWGAYVISAMLSGASNSMHEYFADMLPLKGHMRVQFNRDSGWNMDDPATVTKVIKEWDPVIRAAVPRVTAF